MHGPNSVVAEAPETQRICRAEKRLNCKNNPYKQYHAYSDENFMLRQTCSLSTEIGLSVAGAGPVLSSLSSYCSFRPETKILKSSTHLYTVKPAYNMISGEGEKSCCIKFHVIVRFCLYYTQINESTHGMYTYWGVHEVFFRLY